MVEQATGSLGVKCTYKIVNTKNAAAPALEGLITPEDLRKAIQEEGGGPCTGSTGIYTWEDDSPDDCEHDDYVAWAPPDAGID
jgi:hypothetical protein